MSGVRKPNADGSLNADGMTIGAIQPGQAFGGDRIAKDSMQRDWIHVTEVGGKPIDGWSAAWLTDYHDTTVTPPAALPEMPYTYTFTIGDADGPYIQQTITGSGILKPK